MLTGPSKIFTFEARDVKRYVPSHEAAPSSDATTSDLSAPTSADNKTEAAESPNKQLSSPATTEEIPPASSRATDAEFAGSAQQSSTEVKKPAAAVAASKKEYVARMAWMRALPVWF